MTAPLLRPRPSHGSDSPEGLGLILGVGIPVLVLGILAIVFVLVRRSITRQVQATRAQATSEGIVLDSGPIWMTVRYNGFRSSNVMIAVGIRKTRVTAILTRERLILTPATRHYFSITRSDLGRFKVGTAEDGTLHLHTDTPPNASGSLDYRMSVSDVNGWVSALREAGALA